MTNNAEISKRAHMVLTEQEGFFILFTIMALFSTVNPIFAVGAFLLCIIFIARNDNKSVVTFIVYGTFFASIIKIPSITNTSLFTFVIFAATVKMLLSYRRGFSAKYIGTFLMFILLTMIPQITSGYFDVTRNLKFYNNFIYLYIAICSCIEDSGRDINNRNKIFYAFICGVLISSLFRLLDGNLFKITQFVTEKSSNLGLNTAYFRRFSGLYGDPNYYAINVIIALCIILFMYYKGQIRTYLAIPLTIILFAFAIITRSKSAFLALIFPLVLFIRNNFERKKHGLNLLSISAFAIIAYLVITDRITWFSFILSRFRNTTGDLNRLTEGRMVLWANYLNYFSTHTIQTFIGSGISTPLINGGAAHNTYFDIIYHLGILPGLFYLNMIRQLFAMGHIRIHRNYMNFSVLITIIIMYMFLSSLFDIDFTTNILLSVIVYNTSPIIRKDVYEVESI